MTDIKIFTRPVQHMCNYVFRPDYIIQQFVKDLKEGVIEIVGETVLIMIGNNQVDNGEKCNIGKQIGKLAKLICTQDHKLAIFICGLMPRPDKPNEWRLQLGSTNKKIGDMCRATAKYQKLRIKYLPIHQVFLEKYKSLDPATKRVTTISQVIRPIETYFKPDHRTFNHQGRKLLRKKLWEAIDDPSGLTGYQMPVVWKAEQLTIEISANEVDCDTEDSHCASETPAINAKKVKCSEDLAVAANSGVECFRPVKKQKGQVAQLIDKWESNKPNPSSTESLDLELGGEDVVSVPLGDE